MNDARQAPTTPSTHHTTGTNTMNAKQAHTAARYGHLPEGFDRWDMADRYGYTVAHTAARYGHLPEGFDRWDMADNQGLTVAHTAARYGHLPEGFDRWDMADRYGYTVAHIAAQNGNLPKPCPHPILTLKDGTGTLVAEIAGIALPRVIGTLIFVTPDSTTRRATIRATPLTGKGYTVALIDNAGNVVETHAGVAYDDAVAIASDFVTEIAR